MQLNCQDTSINKEQLSTILTHFKRHFLDISPDRKLGLLVVRWWSEEVTVAVNFKTFEIHYKDIKLSTPRI